MFLKNKDKKANFELLETHREGEQTFVVVSSRNEVDARQVQDQAKELGYQFLGVCVRDGKPSGAFTTSKTEKEVVQDLAGNKPLETVKISKTPNMWFWRGLMGLTGQLLNLTHAKMLGDGALKSFAQLNIVANSMAMVFGAQKRSDEVTLKRLNNEFDHLTAESGGRADVGEQVEKAQDAEKKAHPEKMDEVTREKQGVMGFIRSNSVKIQHFLRLVASSLMLRDGLKDYAADLAKAKNDPSFKASLPLRLPASGLILPGKLIGMIAEDENPELLPQEKKGFWKNFKVNANQIGSLIELTGFTLLAYEGITKPHKMEVPAGGMSWAQQWGKKVNIESGWMQAAGQGLFVASYMIQSVAPLSKKVFPVERALQSASWHLQTVQDDERDQTAVSMAHQMYRAVPKMRTEGLAKTLGQIYTASKLPVHSAPGETPVIPKRSLYASAGQDIPVAALASSAIASADHSSLAAESRAPTVQTEPAAPTLSEVALANHEKTDRQPANPEAEVRKLEVVKSWQARLDEKKHEEPSLTLQK